MLYDSYQVTGTLNKILIPKKKKISKDFLILITSISLSIALETAMQYASERGRRND